jgi:hypothetical protein
MTRYPIFDRSQIELAELARRGHDLRIEDCLPLAPPPSPYCAPGRPLCHFTTAVFDLLDLPADSSSERPNLRRKEH